MLFNSLEFFIFLPISFIIYWFVLNKNLKAQNIFLLFASYVFYGWWDVRFLGLIAFSSIVDYLVGWQITKAPSQGKRQSWLVLSLVVNLGLLFVFKYFNFFIESFVTAFESVGVSMHVSSLKLILPVGISFYTFQTLSYSIDIYKDKLKPEKDWVSFFAFVSFFPQLVAGPIERAVNLLPQFKKPRVFTAEKGKQGLRYILWGLFKKVVVADSCAIMADDIFANYGTLPSSVLVLGTIYFAFQIYADFSGYSDIAIGVAKLFGFDLMINFSFPYFARDIAEFWRRWHISLTTWFRDYVYIPLGGSKRGKTRTIINVFIIFLVSGFWHGANWTYIWWGLINAILFIPMLVMNKNRKNQGVTANGSVFPGIKEFFQILMTFTVVCFAWIFFRAENIGDAFNYSISLLDSSLLAIPEFRFLKYLMLLAAFVIWEWFFKHRKHGLDFSSTKPPLRWVTYVVITLMVINFYGEDQQFIYFQF